MSQEKHLHILLVDDDEDELVIVRSLLAHTNKYELDWASGYDEALAKVTAQSYDAFLFDYYLGARTGIELLIDPQIQQLNLPVVILTGQDDLPTLDRQALLAGAADYLNKRELTPQLLERTLRFAIAKNGMLNELRRGEARYRAIVDGQTEFVVRFNHQYALTFVNQSYVNYRQPVSYDTLLGSSVLETVHPDDWENIQVAVDFLSPDDPGINLEVRTPEPPATRRWHHWSIRAIYDEQAQFVEYQALIRDITERKEVEYALNLRINELRTLRRVDAELTDSLKLDSVITLALDSTMRLSAADVAVMALWQDEAQEFEIKQVYGVAETQTLEDIYRQKRGIIARVLHTKQAQFIPDMSADPDCIPTLPTMTSQIVVPMLSQDQFIGIISLETAREQRFTPEVFDFIQLMTVRIAVALDNARLYELQRVQLEELRNLYRQVSHLEQLKTDMIRIASHDLRNPLGIIQGYIEVLQWDIDSDKLTPDKLREYLEAMTRVTHRMRKITSDILSVDRIERSAEITAEMRVDLTKIISETAQEQTDYAASKAHTYVVHLPSAPTVVLGDAAQLREAVANLIGNAIKYTPNGGRIEVSLESDGDAAVFEVTDNGYGVPYELQARLFQPFYRAKTRETTSIDGTGLGLHLVKNIIERHQGRMIFRSRYQEGSTFGFQIPTQL